MVIREWLEKNKAKYFETGLRKEGIIACAEELGMSIGGVQNKAASVWPMKNTKKSLSFSNSLSLTSKRDGTKDILTPDEFISEIDVVRHVMHFLDSEVKDGYIEDEKLRRHFEMGISKWNEVKRLPVWEARIFIYTKPTGQKATVWSSAKGIELARKTISMARYEL